MGTVPTEPVAARTSQLPAGRKAEIAEYVRIAGQVTVASVAAHFGVSRDTVRRDLDQLDSEGLLIRTHGGAVGIAEHPHVDTTLSYRTHIRTHAKDAIGQLAASLVESGSVLMLNGGTTVLAAIHHVRRQRDLTIVTNNLHLPSEVSPKVLRDLYVLGGAVSLSTQTTVGPVSFRVASSGIDHDVQADLALIGVGAVSSAGGFSTSSLAEASMMMEMMRRSAKVAVLADSSKFERDLFARIGCLGTADYFITDLAPSDQLAHAFRDAGVTVLTPSELSPEPS